MRNSYGIEVKKCCASCRYKDLTRLMTSRYCTQHQKAVAPQGCCKQWALSEQMEAVGSGLGKVKRKAYLKYVIAVREEESLAAQRGLKIVCKSLDQIRQEFEKNQGSIFVEI